MKPNKLYYNTALKALENKNNFLVWWFPWNGIIRNNDGEEIGIISTKVMDKLVNHDNIRHIGNGSDLLDHEKYYKLNLTRKELELKNEGI